MAIGNKDMPAFIFDDASGCMTLFPPKEFSFAETLTYLTRSPLECMHHVEDGKVYKLLEIEEEPKLLEISALADSSIQLRILGNTPQSPKGYETAVNHVVEWFDLRTNLAPFYLMAKHDPLLGRLTSDYFGLRIIGIPDLFEALCWAIIGQQVNLNFAYTLKKRFVEAYGKPIWWGERIYWLFPQARDLTRVSIEELRKLQLTGKKAEYIVGIAQLIESGELSKEILRTSIDIKVAEQQLKAIRGIGAWTANYVLMRCLRYPSAFPIGDAGLHNALKRLLNRTQKPEVEEIRNMFMPWQDWEAYAVFYLWRSLHQH